LGSWWVFSGCIGPIAAKDLTVEQIAAMKDYNGDAYVCGQAGGPPGNGFVVFILLPKGSTNKITFGPDCHPTVQ
jgi:hypothetical protein